MVSKIDKSTQEGNVMVVCRFRPFNAKEKEMGAKPVAEFNKDGQHITIKTQVSFLLSNARVGRLQDT